MEKATAETLTAEERACGLDVAAANICRTLNLAPRAVLRSMVHEAEVEPWKDEAAAAVVAGLRAAGKDPATAVRLVAVGGKFTLAARG